MTDLQLSGHPNQPLVSLHIILTKPPIHSIIPSIPSSHHAVHPIRSPHWAPTGLPGRAPTMWRCLLSPGSNSAPSEVRHRRSLRSKLLLTHPRCHPSDDMLRLLWMNVSIVYIYIIIYIYICLIIFTYSSLFFFVERQLVLPSTSGRQTCAWLAPEFANWFGRSQGCISKHPTRSLRCSYCCAASR